MDLAGKNVCFVGSFGAIGFETCKILMSKHLKSLVLLDQSYNEEAINALKPIDGNCAIFFCRYDVTRDSNKLKTILDDVGRLDIFIYGAGICNDHEIDRTVQVNFVGLMKALSIVFPHMDKSKGGNGGMIVTIASVAGLDASPAMPVYSATKAAVISATRALAYPTLFSKTGVSFITICPTLTKTPLLNNMNSFLDLYKQLTQIAMNLPAQSAGDCARNLVAAIEQGGNDKIWLLDMGKLEIVEPKKYRDMPDILKESFKQSLNETF